MVCADDEFMLGMRGDRNALEILSGAGLCPFLLEEGTFIGLHLVDASAFRAVLRGGGIWGGVGKNCLIFRKSTAVEI